MKPGESAKTTFARSEAARLAAEVAARIPSLVVTVAGVPEHASYVVRVDDTPLAPALFGQPRAVDPGDHVVALQVEGGTSAVVTVHVDERETKAVELRPPSPPEPPKVVASHPDPVAREQPPVAPPPPKGAPTGMVVSLTFAALSLGSFVTMIVTGTIAKDQIAIVDQHCSAARECDALGLSAASKGSSYATVANVALGVGIGFAALSAVIGFVSSRSPAVKASVTPIHSGAMVGLDFAF